MMLPDAEKDHQDFIDFMADACKKTVLVKQSNGEPIYEQQLDWKKIYYKTQLINSNTYSRLVLETELLEGMAFDCKNHMTEQRALTLSSQIMNYVDAIRYSMDAKSSEVVRNKDNTQSSLTHLLTRVRVERNYSAKEEMKEGILSGFGKDKNKDNNI